MKHIAALLISLSLALPAAAEDQGFKELFKELENMSDQAQGLLEGLAKEFGPKLDEMAPLLDDLAGKLGDISAYHAPEVLENGDIIIRRKTPLEPEGTPSGVPPEKADTIDL